MGYTVERGGFGGLCILQEAEGSQVLVGGGGVGDVSRLRQQCCSQAGAAAVSPEIAGAHATTTAPVYFLVLEKK